MKRFRALNSTSKTHSLPGKAPYSGPKKFTEICRAIVQDAKVAGIELSYDFVFRVIRLFFARIMFYIYAGKYISITGFGDFGMSQEKKIQRLDHIKKRNNSERKGYKKKKATLRKKEKKRQYLIRKHKRGFEKVNNSRAKIGLKPLTIDTYIHITKKRKPRKLRVKPKFNYTFEVLDMLEQSK